MAFTRNVRKIAQSLTGASGVAKAISKQTPSGTQISATSLNISSVTDGSTGINTTAFTNAFNSASETVTTGICHDNNYNRAVAWLDTSASQSESRTFRTSVGDLIDDFDFTMITHGNLA
tara:strand:- start:29 stop:385 length:357 start_codon:yes stop_codon:yes gene_type:complete